MQENQSEGPTTLRKVEFVAIETTNFHLSINGRPMPRLARFLEPIARSVFAWLMWRQRRRAAKHDSRTT